MSSVNVYRDSLDKTTFSETFLAKIARGREAKGMHIPLTYVDDACVCNVTKANGRNSFGSSIFNQFRLLHGHLSS